MVMKISKKQLQKLIESAIEKKLDEDYKGEDQYAGLEDIRNKYATQILDVLLSYKGRSLDRAGAGKVLGIFNKALLDAYKEGEEGGWDQGVADELMGSNRP